MPHDIDWPEDCDDCPSAEECPGCPDPDRDQDTLTDCLNDADGVEFTDNDSGNDLTPFTINVSAEEVEIPAGKFAYDEGGDGISFTVSGVLRKIEWAYRDAGPPTAKWHTCRVSFDGGAVVTVYPA